jgi:hypothetical protein
MDLFILSLLHITHYTTHNILTDHDDVQTSTQNACKHQTTIPKETELETRNTWQPINLLFTTWRCGIIFYSKLCSLSAMLVTTTVGTIQGCLPSFDIYTFTYSSLPGPRCLEAGKENLCCCVVQNESHDLYLKHDLSSLSWYNYYEHILSHF